MNFDRTFCTSEVCKLSPSCDRHGTRIKEWAADNKKVVTRPISMADFYNADEVCKWYGETPQATAKRHQQLHRELDGLETGDYEPEPAA